jgi:hypothetical protein
MLTEVQQHEIELYGQLLTGSESELDIARLARITYLKKKMRPRLAAVIGDTPDNVTDVLRAVILGEAIALGIVTDQDVIDGHAQYVSVMLAGYGGAEAILGVMQQNMGALRDELIAGYYEAKKDILTSWSVEEINRIDLQGESVNANVL